MTGTSSRVSNRADGASDLVKVEVLVPKARRDEIVNAAAELRSEHRAEKSRLVEFIRIATERYGL